MSDVTIYHNPRCSKSRQTLALIEAAGVTPQIVEYLNTPLNAPEIQSICAMLAVTPREMMRTKESIYIENNLHNATDGELIDAMVSYPILMERPIVVSGDRAVIGRPPENVHQILG
ncbi:MAG: arsenate reductase [Limisphaerales bacterium]|jgi:arsenate reductase